MTAIATVAIYTMAKNCSKLVHFEAQKNILYVKKSTNLEQFSQGSVTKIEMILSVVRHPRWRRQVKTHVAVTGIITNKCRQCK